ncbi:MAG TPA: alpha/beta hydrolase [Mycobacteriales bacterium]|nr:alpha/beta hydrolase [Mycobacteriales bacterium]
MKPARLSAADLPILGVLPPWPGRREDLDGAGVYVRDTPCDSGGEPALYVHGLGGSATNWTDLAALLSSRLDGQAIDLPGFGYSDPPPHGDYTQRALAERVARWIEHSGRGPVHLFGNSLGGAVAIRVAATRPDLVRTLTLVSPAVPQLRTDRSRARMVPMMFLPNVERVATRRIADLTPEQLALGVLSLCYADPSRIPPSRLEEAVAEAERRMRLPHAAEAYVRSFRGLVTSYLQLGGRSLWRLAARVQAPTLIVWGREDRLVPVRHAARTARVIPDSRLLLLRGVGHTAQMEAPEPVARAVLGMLD